MTAAARRSPLLFALGLVLTGCLLTATQGCGGKSKNRIADVSQNDCRAADCRAAGPAALARAWAEADALFRSEPRWLGGDGAFSVDLGRGRTLWLFGDSFIAAGQTRTREASVMVRNSIALQTGSDPGSASLQFFWRTDPNGSPASFFAEQGEQGEQWFWPAHGIVFEDELTLFLYRIGEDSAPGSLGFKVMGWSAVRIADPGEDPMRWQIERLDTPATGEIGLVGTWILRRGGHICAFAVREPGNRDILLLRWTDTDFKKGDLTAPQWWGGPGRRWAAAAPVPVMQQGSTEFSVSRLPGTSLWVQVQSRGFGNSPVALRFSAKLTGPFSDPCDVYLPPEAAGGDILLYAAKAHPQLEGADLVVTYVANTLDSDRLMSDTSVYYPRFARIFTDRLPAACKWATGDGKKQRPGRLTMKQNQVSSHNP